MNAHNLKSQLHQLIEDADEQELLEIYKKINPEPGSGNWWAELSETQKARILESEQQYRKGEVISNEAVLQKIQQWLQK
jgi:hypothetical protein